VIAVPELRVDVAELRAQMGRANVSQAGLAEISGVHRNTVAKVLKNQTADLESIAAFARGLNVKLRAAGQPEISPLDLLIAVGFPSPQMAASDAMNEPAYS
jgi:transcriptional regulator with XRE-family HTH domain